MSVSSLKMEAADQVASARAVPASNESNKWPAALSCAAVAGAMCAMSLLFAWLAAGTLRRCGAMDEEEVLSGVLWGLSPLICAYLFSWTVALSPAPRADVAGGPVLARPACLLLLGVAADKLIAPVAGAAAIVLAPLLTACACGRALAERLQRAGAEPWSAAAVASTPTYQSRAEELEEREDKARTVFAMKFVAVTLSVSVCFLLPWLVPVTEWEAPQTEVVFYLAGPSLLAARLMLPGLVESPVVAAIGDMQALAAVIGVICWVVVAVLVSTRIGTIAGTVVVWIGELGMVGFLGYFLAVEAHYKELMDIKRKEPRRAKDASGLLDGRDSGDDCSAHIDIDAAVCCLCLDRVLPRCWQ